MKELISSVLILSILLVSVPFAQAQSTSKSFEVETLVGDGKKSKAVKSLLTFSETSFEITRRKQAAKIKEFKYASVKTADYSHSKKPLLSVGGAVVTAVLIGVLVLPFLFMKKKQHWLSIRTDSDYVVLKLDKENFRQVLNEFETRRVPVKTVTEEDSKQTDK